MVDPTSDLEANVDPESAPTCATYGEPTANNPTHHVVTWVEDNAVQVRHFCDDDCRDTWDDER